MEFHAKIVGSFHPLIIFSKSSIIDIRRVLNMPLHFTYISKYFYGTSNISSMLISFPHSVFSRIIYFNYNFAISRQYRSLVYISTSSISRTRQILTGLKANPEERSAMRFGMNFSNISKRQPNLDHLKLCKIKRRKRVRHLLFLVG